MFKPVSRIWFEALVVVTLVAGWAPPAPGQSKPHHTKAGITCVMCHDTRDVRRYEPVGTAKCSTCHDRAALIKKTERVNKSVREKNPVTGQFEIVVKDLNPHSGHHDRGRLDCFECHREHKPPKNLCAQCHDVERWMRQVP
jgi:hypothetical protein